MYLFKSFRSTSESALATMVQNYLTKVVPAYRVHPPQVIVAEDCFVAFVFLERKSPATLREEQTEAARHQEDDLADLDAALDEY